MLAGTGPLNSPWKRTASGSETHPPLGLRGPGHSASALLFCPYSPDYVEQEFREVRCTNFNCHSKCHSFGGYTESCNSSYLPPLCNAEGTEEFRPYGRKRGRRDREARLRKSLSVLLTMATKKEVELQENTLFQWLL